MTYAKPRYRFDAQTYSPPKSVQETAARAVQWIDQGRAGSGFSATGRTLAATFSRGDAVSLDVIERLEEYFVRRASDTRVVGFDSGEAGYPTLSRIEWDARGGDAGMRWVAAIIAEIKRAEAKRAARQDDKTKRGVRQSDAARVRWDDAGSGLSPEDRALLDPPRQLPDGSWLLHTLVARGDEPKAYPWGTEVVPCEELADPETVASFEGAVITVGHPPEMITPQSAPAHAIPDARVTRAAYREDARALTAYLLLPTKPTQQGVSVGWDLGRLDTSTSPPSQRDLRANHIALTNDPRVPGVGPRLDANGAPPMEEIEVTLPDGKIVKIPKSVAPYWEAMKLDRDNLRAEVDRIKMERDKLQGAADAGSKETEAARMDARVRAEVAARTALLRRAERVLGAEELPRLDALSPREVKVRMLAKLDPKRDPKDWSDAYLDGTLDTLGESTARLDSVTQQLIVIDGQRYGTTQGGTTRADANTTPTLAQINAAARNLVKKS